MMWFIRSSLLCLGLLSHPSHSQRYCLAAGATAWCSISPLRWAISSFTKVKVTPQPQAVHFHLAASLASSSMTTSLVCVLQCVVVAGVFLLFWRFWCKSRLLLLYFRPWYVPEHPSAISLALLLQSCMWPTVSAPSFT